MINCIGAVVEGRKSTPARGGKCGVIEVGRQWGVTWAVGW